MQSALAELRSAACSFETVLFALFHSRVAGQETGSLQSGAIVLIQNDEGAGDAMTDRAGLTGNAAAFDGGFHIDLADGAGSDQGLTDDELQGLKAEIIIDLTAVDGDNAGAVGDQVNRTYRVSWFCKLP